MNTGNISLHSLVAGTVMTLAIISACGNESDADLVASAKTNIEKNDGRTALVQLKTVLGRNPQFGEARYLLGKAFLISGDASAALVELNKAKELHQDENDVIPEIARAMLHTGKNKQLVDLFGSTVLARPAALVDLKTSFATALLRQGMREQAELAIASALSMSADFPAALLLRARLKALDGDFDAALAIAENILVKDPKYWMAWHLRGDVYLSGKGDKKNALQAYRSALELEPRLLAAHYMILELLLSEKDIEGFKVQILQLKKALPAQPEVQYFEAQLALVERNSRKGRELVQQLLRQAPDDLRFLQLAAAIEYNGQILGQAEAYLKKALQVAPKSAFPKRLLAQIYLQYGQPERALTILAPLLVENSGDSETLAIAAEAELTSGNLQLAEHYFSRAVKLKPDDAKTRTALALTHLSMGKADAASLELESIAATDPGTIADLALISTRMKDMDLDGALRAIAALEVKIPNKPLAHQLRGRVKLASKSIPEARISFERALQLNPRYLPAATSLAGLDLADGKSQLALQRYDAILKLDPENPKIMLAMAQLKTQTGAPPLEVETLLRKAVSAAPNDADLRARLVGNLLTQKRFKDAVGTAQDAVAAIPENPKIVESLAQAQLNAGDSKAAIENYRRLAAAAPKSVEPQLRLAAAYLADRNRQAAAQSYRRALDLRPDLAIAQASLIALSVTEKRYDEALQLARTAQRQRPEQATGWVYEGDVELARKNHTTSISAYKTAFSKEKATDIAIKLLNALRSGGRLADAAKFIEGMDSSAPLDSRFQMYLADESLSGGNFAAAEARYRTVVANQPKNALALNNLAFVLVKQSKIGAVDISKQANELLPGQPALLDTFAMALASDRQFSQAIDKQNEAIRYAPQDPNLQLNLARILIASGKVELARKQLLELAALGDKFQDWAEVGRLTQSLR